jgi:hypothetical protein
LNQAVQRNRERFPEAFMFRLEKRDTEFLRSQFAIANAAGRGRRPRSARRDHAQIPACAKCFQPMKICAVEWTRSEKALRREISSGFRNDPRDVGDADWREKTIGFHAKIELPAKSANARTEQT